SGPKQLSQAKCAPRSYVALHSLHLRFSIAIRSPFPSSTKKPPPVGQRSDRTSPTSSRPSNAPAGVGTLSRTEVRGGCRGFDGPGPSTPLDVAYASTNHTRENSVDAQLGSMVNLVRRCS